MPDSARLHRAVTRKPEKADRGFIEPVAMAQWLPQNGVSCTVHRMDPKVGGSYKMSVRNCSSVHSRTFGGQFVKLVPNEPMGDTDGFEDSNLPGEIREPVTLTQSLRRHENLYLLEGVRMSFRPTRVVWSGKSPYPAWRISSSQKSPNGERVYRPARPIEAKPSQAD